MTTQPTAWDRRADEPAEAYARFLSYRNIGPGRSLSLAVSLHTATARAAAGEPARGHRPPVPGQWCDDSAKYDWCARAVAWDVHTLTEHGQELVRLWLSVLHSALKRAAEALADPDIRPTSFGGALGVLAQIAPYMTPDVLRTFQPAGADDRTGIEDRSRAELAAAPITKADVK